MVGRKKVVFGITKRTVSKRQDGRKSRVIGIILRKNGVMSNGWVKDGSHWYYLKPMGQMQTGMA